MIDTCPLAKIYWRHFLISLSYLCRIWRKYNFSFHFKNSEPHRFVNEVESDFVEEYGEQSEEHCEDGIGHKKGVPEPNSEVDLFVDYVLQKRDIVSCPVISKSYLGEDAKAIVELSLTGGAHIGNRARHLPQKMRACFLSKWNEQERLVGMQCFRKWNLVLRTWGQKLFNGEKKDFWVKKGPKKDPL